MAVESNRSITVSYNGDVNGVNVLEAANSTISPGQIQYIDLASGNNAITKPTGAVAITILLPSTNTLAVTVKGTNADTGVAIHLTDPTSLGLGSGVTTLVLSAASTITAARLFWS